LLATKKPSLKVSMDKKDVGAGVPMAGNVFSGVMLPLQTALAGIYPGYNSPKTSEPWMTQTALPGPSSSPAPGNNMTCTKGHPLVEVSIENIAKIIPSYSVGASCDICKRHLDSKETVRHCDACRYDLCSSCWNTPGIQGTPNASGTSQPRMFPPPPGMPRMFPPPPGSIGTGVQPFASLNSLNLNTNEYANGAKKVVESFTTTSTLAPLNISGNYTGAGQGTKNY